MDYKTLDLAPVLIRVRIGIRIRNAPHFDFNSHFDFDSKTRRVFPCYDY